MSNGWSTLAGWHGRTLGRVVLLPEIDSTNAEALRRIDRGERAAQVLVAERQTGGHGSRGRPWDDRPGRSLALTAQLPWPASSPLSLATWLGVVAVRDALRDFGLEARLKWPNDALLDGGKVAGVLAEVRTQGGRAVALGIGLNVGHARDELPSGCATPPTSLALHGVTAAPPAVACCLLEALERRFAALLDDGRRGAEELRDAFLEGTGLAGRIVVARTAADETLQGRLAALAVDGELTLEQGARRLVVQGAHVTALSAWVGEV